MNKINLRNKLIKEIILYYEKDKEYEIVWFKLLLIIVNYFKEKY